MSKWFEVEVQTLVVYAIEVKDGQNETDAIDTVVWEMDREMAGRSTYTAQPLPAEHAETFKKNAHRVRALDPESNSEDDDE
jgi:hypothetical protein